MHMIEGLDNEWRFYVGQSDNMSYRIRRQHQNFRYRRDHPSFHNYAMQNSHWDHFIILAVLPPGSTTGGFNKQEQTLLLNMLEMWCALLFCTVQPETLAQWHEYGATAGDGRPWFGLNLACPLEYGGPAKYINWRHPLSESQNPLAQAYVVEVLDGKRELTPTRGLVYGLMVGAFVVICMMSISTGSSGRGRGKAW